MGQEAAAGIGADTEDFSAGTHAAVGGVVQGVAFKAAWSFQGESGSHEAAWEGCQVVGGIESEFDFGFHGHGKE